MLFNKKKYITILISGKLNCQKAKFSMISPRHKKQTNNKNNIFVKIGTITSCVSIFQENNITIILSMLL